MSKLTNKIFLSIVTIVVLYSCRSNEKQTENDVPKTDVKEIKKSENVAVDVDCATVANFFIHQNDAEPLMAHFEKIYQKKGTADENKNLIDSFWVDSCLLMTIKKFLTTNTTYDGIRIYSTAKAKVLGGNSNALIVPTIPSAGTHDAQWGERFKPNECTPRFKNYDLKQNIARDMRRKFEKNFRKEQKEGEPTTALLDSLSRGIWFSKCVVDSLAKYIGNPALKLDGFFIHCAAYKKIEPGTKQKYLNQSTFILVLSRSSRRGGHENAWDIINGLSWLKKYDGGYNHGELCPDDCPTGEK